MSTTRESPRLKSTNQQQVIKQTRRRARRRGLIRCRTPRHSISNVVPPIVVTTWAQNGFLEATRHAYAVLTTSRRCIPSRVLDAVERGCNFCERPQRFSNYECGCDGSVGLGSSPNAEGETTLDALIMSGTTMNAGAVGCLKRVSEAISVARKVMYTTKHTLLVGEDATRFAVSHGFRERSLTTPRSAKLWRAHQRNKRRGRSGFGRTSKSKLIRNSTNRTQVVPTHDTIGIIAMSHGRIACGTSTSGATFKVPGRVGDSPIPGSGAYCEDGVGGAVATGDGDVLIRFCPSFAAVQYLRLGCTPTIACEKALAPMRKYVPQAFGAIVCVAATGVHGAAAMNVPGGFRYSVCTKKCTQGEVVIL